MNTEFRAAILEAGLQAPDHITPGKMYRFPGAEKKASNRAGWCKLFGDAGVFGDFSTGLSETWFSASVKAFSMDEKVKFKKQVAEARKEAEAQRQEQQQKAAIECNSLWLNASPETGKHKYLRNKNILPHGIRTDGFNLLIPMYDENKKICSIQSINPNGDKLFHKYGRVKGCYYPIGKPDDVLCLAEGFATAATIREATGHAVAVCFNAGNLKEVGMELKRKLPEVRFVFCADDDLAGITKAREASASVDGVIAVPEFGDTRRDGDTDFNDMARLLGLDAVKTVINAAQTGEHNDASENEKADVTVARLAKLSDAEYELVRVDEAKKLKFRTSVLDKLVNQERPDSDNASGSEVRFNDVDMASEEVTGSTAFDEGYAHIKRHMFITDQDATIAVLWAAHTHMYNQFNHTPRLVITAPEPECGKTVLLFHMIGNLSNRVLATDNLTPAVFFRLSEKHKPTFLIDEGDVFLNQDSDLMAGFNNGFEPHGGAFRCVGDDNEVRLFSTFAPLALAGIGIDDKLPAPTLSRAHIIYLDRALNEIAEPWDKDIHRQGFLATRAKFARWIHDNSHAIARGKPCIPDTLKNRAKDKWLPLFAIAEAAGGDWPQMTLDAYERFLGSDSSEHARIILLRDIQAIFTESNCFRISSAALVDKLTGIEDSPWATWRHGQPMNQNSLARLLKPFKIRSKTIRIGRQTPKGFEAKQFAESFIRYIPPLQTATPQQTDCGTGYSGFQSATQDKDVVVAKCLKPSCDAVCCGVAVQERVNDDSPLKTPDSDVFDEPKYSEII